jgi:hypothetical protein
MKEAFPRNQVTEIKLSIYSIYKQLSRKKITPKIDIAVARLGFLPL